MAATESTLRVLGERIARGQATELAALFPRTRGQP